MSREEIGASLLPYEKTTLDEATTLARQQLSPEEAEAAWTEGASMSLEEAVDYALNVLAISEAEA